MDADTTDAGDPFSPNSDELNPPDIILRSSDRVDFYVHKPILVFGSPVFANMFAFPTPVGADANPTKDGKPVILLPESSKTVEKLLVLWYPRFTSSYQIRDLDGIADAYAGARKYDIAGGTALLDSLLADPRILEKNAYRVYAVACHLGLEPIAKLAAVETLKLLRFDPAIGEIPEFARISGQQLWKLGTFHQQCSSIHAEIALGWDSPLAGPNLENLEESDDSQFGPYVWYLREHTPGCGPYIWRVEGIAADMFSPPEWFRDHIDRVKQACIIRPHVGLIARSLTELAEPTLEMMSGCAKCVKLAQNSLKRLAASWEQDATSKIEAVLDEYLFTA